MPLGANKAAIMGVAGVSTADVVLLSSQTADDASTITFSSGITSTYGEYIFRWYNFKPSGNNIALQFGINATDGADYDDSLITSTFFQTEHRENDDDALVGYQTSVDRAQAALVQTLDMGVGDGADESGCGELHIFNPSSTTYVKHFMAQSHVYHTSDYPKCSFVAGYINDTTAIDDVQFKVGSGTFDGKFKMWGVK
jgi:hypothetical protein